MFKTKRLIALQSVLFLAFLVVTALFNQLAADDYYYLGAAKEKSLVDNYAYLYLNWNGRWAANALLAGCFYLFGKINLVGVYTLLSFALLYYSCFRFLKAALKRINYAATLSYHIYTGVFLSVLFFCFPSPNEVWFWLTANMIYFISAACFFLMAAILLYSSKGFLDISLLLVSCLFIGGSNEPLAVFSLLAIGYVYVQQKKALYLMAAGTLLLGFAVNYFSVGTATRGELHETLSLTNLMLYSGYGSLKFLFFSFYKSFLPALLLSVPFYFLGIHATNNSKGFHPIKTGLKFCLFIGVIVFVNNLMVSYAIASVAPFRSLTVSSIAIALMLCVYAFQLGNSKTEIGVRFLLPINVLGVLCLVLIFTPVHFNYQQAVAKRITVIKNSQQSTVELKPLPYNGFLYSTEITSDTAHFLNEHLAYGLQADKSVKLGKD